MSLFGNIIPWFKRGPALNRQTVAMEQLMKGNALWGANPDVLVTAVTAYHAGNIAQLAKIVDAYERKDADALIALHADYCFNCGSCTFVCPARRPVTQNMALAKEMCMNRMNELKEANK